MDINIIDPLKFDITPERLAMYDPPRRPLIAGNSWWFRICILDDDGLPVDLTAVTQTTLIEMLMSTRLKSGSATFSRRSDTNRTGISPTIKQIVIDDQTGDGKGFITIYFDPGDKEDLLLLGPLAYYEIRVTYASGEVVTEVAGRIAIKHTPGSY